MKDWHSLKVSECYELLQAGEDGLSSEQAAKRLLKYGPNELPRKKDLTAYKIFFSQFKNALIYILILTGVLSLFIGAGKEAAVIFGAVLINVIIGFIQENKANRAIIKLRLLVEQKAYVLRDGQEAVLESAAVVPGDVMVIRAGNRLPADARIIEAAELLVNEAMLTGESLPAHKKAGQSPKGAVVADRNNMVFAGTIVLNGSGRALVTATGPASEIGRIAGLVESAKEEKTPLQIRLAGFSRFLAYVFAVVCLLIVAIGLGQGRSLKTMLETGVALGVASIPEGLLVSVTFILALSMQRILKERALTRKLVAVETLGSVTVICSDKTGTLTAGKMSVVEASAPVLRAGALCNDAVIENPEDPPAEWRFIGSPTETALVRAAAAAGLDRKKLLEQEPRIAVLSFDSRKKYMISLHQAGRAGYKLYEKGAPEIVLAKCAYLYEAGKAVALDKDRLARLKSISDNFSRQGLRVIGIAEKDLYPPDTDSRFEAVGGADVDWDELDRDLVFVGFAALKDPLRPEAAKTVRLAKAAGVRTVMITGDHKLTARAIAREIGLRAKPENILSGRELDALDDAELSRLSGRISVYARVSPHHKLRIVKILQAKGEVVAMTGDGINDSPALKAADIGIALGHGADVAKETADIVLLDNNFQTIVSAIRQGRTAFKKIRKATTYLISDSFSEITLIVGSIILNAPLAILPAQILWINIVNDGLPHFSLAYEQDHGNVMAEKPLDKHAPIMDQHMKAIIFGVGLFRDLLLFALFYYFYKKWQFMPERLSYLSTLIFMILGLKSLLSIFSLRSFSRPIWAFSPFSNRYLVLAVLASFLLLLLSIYWGPLRDLLGNSGGINYTAWLAAFLFAGFNVILLEGLKYYYILKKRKVF